MYIETHTLKRYLENMFMQARTPINLDSFNRSECLELWERLKNKYRIIKDNNKYILNLHSIDEDEDKYYRKLLKDFFIPPLPLPLEEWKDYKNFKVVYEQIIFNLPDSDKKIFRKVRYFWERKPPRLKITDKQKLNLSQKWKDILKKLSEIFKT